MYIPEIPNNSLKDVLEEIVYIAQKAEETGLMHLRFSFNTPASEVDILKCEKALNINLADDYKDFLRFSNGATLCYNDAVFYSTSDIISYDELEKSDDFHSDYIMIADIIGDGEILCFSRKKGIFVSYFDGEEETFDSFLDFLKNIVSFIRKNVEEQIEL